MMPPLISQTINQQLNVLQQLINQTMNQVLEVLSAGQQKSFISKSTGKKCEDKKASRRSEEVKNQVDPLSKFNICWVKIQLFSQSWESFQTRMRTGFSWRRGRGRHWSASSGICCDCSRYPPEDLKLGTHIAIRWSIWADPQKTPFDPFWRYTFSQVLVLKLTLPFQGFDPARHSPLSHLTCLTRR